MILKDLQTEKLIFKKNSKKYLKKFLMLFISFECFQVLGSIMFFYVEECLAYGVHLKPPPPGNNDLNTFCVEICNELSRVVNVTLGNVTNNNTLNTAVIKVIQNATNLCKTQGCVDSLQHHIDSPTTCQLTVDKIMKWATFSYAVVYTVGYGDIVPKSKLGKLLTMIYAVCGIPIAGACLVLCGRAIQNSIQLLIVNIEQNLLKRQQVEYLQRKTIASVILLMLASLLSFATGQHLLSRELNDYDIFDWFYFSFITTSTIGFGDMTVDYDVFKSVNPALQTFLYLLLYTIFFFGMSTVASLISAMTNFETERSYKRKKNESREQTTIETIENKFRGERTKITGC